MTRWRAPLALALALVVPIAIAGFLFIVSPGFLAPMFAPEPNVLGLPAGVVMLLIGGMSMFFGFMAIRRIVDIQLGYLHKRLGDRDIALVLEQIGDAKELVQTVIERPERVPPSESPRQE